MEERMQGHNLVAFYQSFSDAERVRDRLISEGFPATDVRLSEPLAATTAEGPAGEAGRPGFFGWLFGGDIPERERGLYEAHLREHRAAVSVWVMDDRLYQRALEVMEECNPIDIDDQLEADRVLPGQRMSAGEPAAGRSVEEGEQVIPVVKEELSVGKRMTERRYRVKTYVVERPVEEQITLRDERVEIEHRPISGAAAAARAGTIPEQREIDVIERHEEPVVAKRTRADEEVVVRKEVSERPETVRDTVRETKVDVEKEPVANETPASQAPRTPPNTRR